MKVLLVGSIGAYAIERHFLKYIGQIEGVVADIFVAHDLFVDFYKKSVANKIRFRLGFSHIFAVINKQLCEKCEAFNPDVLVVFKGMEILPETLQFLKAKRIKLVNYNPDNPFLFSGRGSGNKNVSNSIGLYDLHFTYDHAIASRITEQYKLPARILPFGFEVSEEVYRQSQEADEIPKLCFVGSADRDRARFIASLLQAGVEIDLIGNGWNNAGISKQAQIHEAVYGNEFWITLRKYRAQLNLMRPHNPYSHNMRTFEVPGIGGIMLAPGTTDHRNYFEADHEIFLYDAINDCIDKCKELMSMPAIQANTVRNAARTRSIRSGYTYQDRSRQMINDIKTVLG
jgi:spore maturation protein CgeB